MPCTLFPDGFPTTPIKAINYSYFLSDQEKMDWRVWLKTTSKKNRKDFVEILHSIWQENQLALQFANKPDDNNKDAEFWAKNPPPETDDDDHWQTWLNVVDNHFSKDTKEVA